MIHFGPAIFQAFLEDSILFLEEIGCAGSAQVIRQAMAAGFVAAIEDGALALGSRTISVAIARQALLNLGIETAIVNACEAEFFGTVVSGTTAGLIEESLLARWAFGVRAVIPRVAVAGVRALPSGGINPYLKLGFITASMVVAACMSAGAEEVKKKKDPREDGLVGIMRRYYNVYRISCLARNLLSGDRLKPLTLDEWRVHSFHPLMKEAKRKAEEAGRQYQLDRERAAKITRTWGEHNRI